MMKVTNPEAREAQDLSLTGSGDFVSKRFEEEAVIA